MAEHIETCLQCIQACSETRGVLEKTEGKPGFHKLDCEKACKKVLNAIQECIAKCTAHIAKCSDKNVSISAKNALRNVKITSMPKHLQ